MISIKQQIFSGIFYTAIARYSGIIISLGITAILARLLSPNDFGIVAVATVIINFFGIFANIGIPAAIIQNKELAKNDLNAIYMFTLWMGGILSLLFFLSAWGIAKYYQDNRLILICKLLSINLFFTAASIVPNSMFYRDKDFKFIAFRTFIVQIIVGVLSILAALKGMGLYTLVIQPILSSLIVWGISLRKYPQQLRLTFGIKSVKKIWNYSMYQFLFSIISYFTRNLDKLLIGKYMGLGMLGYYEKSYRLMMLPLQNITYVVTPVMHPILSDYQNDMEKLGHTHERVMRILAFIGFPLSLVLLFCARELVLCVFGTQWGPSIPIFQILSLTVGIQLLLSSTGSFYQAGNDTRGLFISGAFSAFTNVLSVAIGIFYFHSLEATSWCIFISFCINFMQCYWQLYRFMLRRKLVLCYRQLLSPLLLSTIIGLTLYFVSALIKNYELILSLSIKAGISLILWATYIQLTKEYDIFAKIKSILNKRRK